MYERRFYGFYVRAPREGEESLPDSRPFSDVLSSLFDGSVSRAEIMGAGRPADLSIRGHAEK